MLQDAKSNPIKHRRFGRHWLCFVPLLFKALELAANAAAPMPLPPLPQGTGFAHLAVPGYLPAVLSWPEAAEKPLPILIAAHGSFDEPEWNCETYKQVVAGAAVVLCPRGRLRWDSPKQPELARYFFPSTGLEKEIDAAVHALQTAYPGRLRAGPFLYAGFSQGAILGVPILIRHPARYPWAILVEGGHGAWNANTARIYAIGGGKRILFACGRDSCLRSARTAAAHLSQAGVQVKVVYAPDQGHTYAAGVQAQLTAAFAWVIEGDFKNPQK